ncbi:MAG: FadR/GntR family transcriptional regulator [Thermodesulfobacteriota bacterium]
MKAQPENSGKSRKRKKVDLPVDQHKTRSREVTVLLLRRIIDGVYPAGSRLPTERLLGEEFGTSRSVIREALKRIEALNLVAIRQGSGAVVQDFQTKGGVELADLLLFDSNGDIDEAFLVEMAQLHEGMHIWVVRLAARHVTPDEITLLKKLLNERASLVGDPERLTGITMEISRRIVQAAHNRFLNLLFNTLARTTRVSRIVFTTPEYFEPDMQHFLERLVEAFAHGDSEMAALLTMRIFKNHKEAFVKAVGLLNMEAPP